jgi:hypothetical protein
MVNRKIFIISAICFLSVSCNLDLDLSSTSIGIPEDDCYMDNEEERIESGDTIRIPCPDAKPKDSSWAGENEDGKFEQTWNGYSWVPDYYECEWVCAECRKYNKSKHTCDVLEFGGGNGEIDDPFIVYLPEHLDEIRYCLDGVFIQTKDIDLKGYLSSDGWLPIGNRVDHEKESSNFEGRYYGQNHKITNLVINNKYRNRQGLFGGLTNALIESVNLVDVEIDGRDAVGAIAGFASTSSIRGCSSSGKISGSKEVGGLIGYGIYTSISKSYSESDIVSHEYGGGLEGFKFLGETRDSYFRGSVSGSLYTGGISGHINNAEITNSYSSGVVKGKDLYGGLIGKSEYESLIAASFWDIETSGIETSDGGTPADSEKMKNINTYIEAGWDFDEIWEMNESVNDGYPFLKAISFFNGGNGSKEDPFQISNSRQLEMVKVFSDSHFIQVDDILVRRYENLRPIGSKKQPFSGSYDGQGFVISEIDILQSPDGATGFFGFIEDAKLKNIVLIDIFVSGNDLTGGLAGHSVNSEISNIFISGQIYGNDKTGGLVGYGESSYFSEIKVSADVGGERSVGGVVGISTSSVIEKSSFAGKVSGTYTTGGITGANYDGNVILNSYCRGDVQKNYGTPFSTIGAFSGYNSDSEISFSYSSVRVVLEIPDPNKKRGFVGSQSGENEYHANFFDSEVSGQTSGIGAEPLVTEEMKTPEIYIEHGWDFDTVWQIDEMVNDGYPYLTEELFL